MANLMTTLSAAVPVIGPALAIGGTILSAIGTIQSGNAAEATAEYNAQQLEAKGKAEYAAAALEAKDEKKRAQLIESRARAVAGASGGGQDIDLLSSIEEEGTYRSLLALWQGEEAMKGRNAQAVATRYEGRQRKRASRYDALGGALKGANSILDNY